MRRPWALLAVLASACGASASTPDAKPPTADAMAADVAAPPVDAARIDARRPPDAADIDAAEPDAGRPDAARPDARVPDAAVPDAARPDAAAPDAAIPDAAVPDVAVPDATRPDAARPDARLPDAAVPDAAVPDAGPSSTCPAARSRVVRADCALIPTHPLSAHSMSLGRLDADTAQDIVLTNGFGVDGHVAIFVGPPPGSLFTDGFVQAVPPGGGPILAETIATGAGGFDYQMALESGIPYQLVAFIYLVFPDGSVLLVRSSDTVTPCGDSTHDIAMPPVAEADPVDVVVSGLGLLDAPSTSAGFFISVSLESNDGSFVATNGTFGGGAPVHIALDVPAGTYTPFVTVTDASSRKDGYAGYVAQFALPQMARTDVMTLDVPPTARMSGTIADPDQQLVPILPQAGGGETNLLASHAFCEGYPRAAFPAQNEHSTGGLWSDTRTYKTFVRKGHTCKPFVSAAVSLGPGGPISFQYENTYGDLLLPDLSVAAPVVVDKDLTFDATVPPLGSQVTLAGTVTNSAGAPQPGANLLASGRCLDADPSASLSVSIQADGNGEYVLHLLPGDWTLDVQLLQ